MKVEYPKGATPLDPDEMEGLKFKHVTTRSELDHLEQANIQNGLVWLSRSREKDILREAFVCKLHERLFGEVWRWAGSFRRSGKNIGVDPVAISVELRVLLDDMRYWVEDDTYPEMEAVIRFHHRLVFIHPFPNGNGRLSRIMTDAVLQKIFGREPIDWSGGHDLQAMNERRSEYIAALGAADRGDYDPLFRFAGFEGR